MRSTCTESELWFSTRYLSDINTTFILRNFRADCKWKRIGKPNSEVILLSAEATIGIVMELRSYLMKHYQLEDI